MGASGVQAWGWGSGTGSDRDVKLLFPPHHHVSVLHLSSTLPCFGDSGLVAVFINPPDSELQVQP